MRSQLSRSLHRWRSGVPTDLYKVPDAVPPIHDVSSHVATDKGLSKVPVYFFATIYNRSQFAERKHVARYWSISAVPVSVHPFPLVITTILAAAILVVAVVRRKGSAGPVLPLWVCPLVLLDLSAAFDNVNHQIIPSVFFYCLSFALPWWSCCFWSLVNNVAYVCAVILAQVYCTL